MQVTLTLWDSSEPAGPVYAPVLHRSMGKSLLARRLVWYFSMPSFLPSLCSSFEIEDLENQMQRLLEKQNFITHWDPETMLPPHTDVVLEATDGRPVHAHRATLVCRSSSFHTKMSVFASGPIDWSHFENSAQILNQNTNINRWINLSTDYIFLFLYNSTLA